MPSKFIKLFANGITGGISGAIAGFLLLFLVKALIFLLCFIFQNSCRNEAPIELLAMLSIGSGTILGGIFGIILFLKKI
ncbi:MAG TPA: hypothetical protein VJB41_03615 [Patescibacteria group bacterium]|nr:hypothetical protein [Patescibacteria group bacterium]